MFFISLNSPVSSLARRFLYFNLLFQLLFSETNNNMVKNIFIIFLCIILISQSGCLNKEKEGSVEANNSVALYFDYKVWSDEENVAATAVLRYRKDGKTGNTILIRNPGKVEFDGHIVHPDSSKMNGFYYEVRIPKENLNKKHSIVFTHPDQRQFKEEFSLPVISLKTEIPKIVRRKDLVLRIDGIKSGEAARVILTDTAFYSRDIDKTDTIRQGRITLTQRDLENLKNGPVYLEIFKEVERPLKETTRAGGRFSLSYGLKREFELKD